MLGENIKKAREKLHISQRELGRRIGKTGQYISYLENNKSSNPSLEVLNEIAENLGVTVNDLLKVNKTLSQKLIDELEYPLIKLFGPADTLEILSDQLSIDYDLLNNNLNKHIDFPEDVQISLLKFLSDIDFPIFMKFIEENRSYISQNKNLNNKVNEIMAIKIHDLEDDSLDSFKKYLFTTFGHDIEEFINEDNIKELQEETEKFLEFALFKIEKEYYGENEEDK
ncbi:helix-turn-helix transcriptional regulator [Clostridium cochlearium]|uniref:helix-turn-helix domain-containing protein n=1 Tax=Clostridium TaxID=1485 RepID=UPI001459B2EE|nr:MULTISPECIES: helix-turn-helix transcriptional regulator [Clostridium]MBE6057654.1 helix-turn-helix transcriptional regulator [Clostridium sp.]NME94562.1 helix-turn-helix transcriptional regulator [Clostridium cochlearium]